MNSRLTAMERTCVGLIAKEHWPDFRLDGLRVTRREHTGVGCFVYLDDLHAQRLEDGVYETQRHAIEMEEVPLGLDFAVTVVSSRIDHLELVTASASGWDGVERKWRIV